MKTRKNINVYSEIGLLKKVLIHRPGMEIENLTPNYLQRMLFDDIPFLKVARKEHDHFARVLKENGVEVVYLEDLAAETLKDQIVKERFLDDFIGESGVRDSKVSENLKKSLMLISEKEMISNIISGIRKSYMGLKEEEDQYPFLTDPMPNLYFTRDSFSSIGRGISINSMKTKARKRESLFPNYIFKYHKDYRDKDIPIWYSRNEQYAIEGGDILVISKELLVFGNSQRTDINAVLTAAERLLSGEDTFKTILMIEIPNARTFMHLDTVLTMVDYDKFTIHKEIEDLLKVRSVKYDMNKKELIINDENESLEAVFSKYLEVDVKIIRCGGLDKITSAREQWNDGANTLAIAPGKVITYDRNYVTNELLVKNDISVIAIPSSELSRGRGGPRCMSMPLYRENI
ncbi:MAG: arginine deiminase [Solirubrobacterales bacterium]